MNRLVVYSLIALWTALASAAPPGAVHVRNFAQVDEYIYRGAAPSETGLKDLRALHVSMIMDLREPGESGTEERVEAQRLGMKYIDIPMRPLSSPTPQEMKQALEVLLAADAGSDRVFVHCRRGRDRTGTVIACYHIQHDHWTNRRAFQDAEKHGISRFERGMRSYILHFQPMQMPSVVAANQ